MSSRLKNSEETVTAVIIKKFELSSEVENPEGLTTIPDNFGEGGTYIAIKHTDSKGELYRVFFSEITEESSKESFFKEAKKMDIAGLLIDLKEQNMWDIELEELDFTKTEECNLSEKALNVIMEIILMTTADFKKSSGEEESGIEVNNISNKEASIDDYEDVRLLAMDAAIGSLQDYIVSTIGGKYDASAMNPEDMLFSKYGKPINIFNASKYMARYLNDDGDKASNPADILKAAHYLMFELSRIIILKNEE